MRHNFKEMNKRLDEREEEINRLNNIIKSQMYCKYANNCDEIYDCTKEEYNSMCEINMEMSLEITRLNNIINKLEKWLNDEIYRHEEVYKPSNSIFIENGELHKVSDKLKELKGSDSNE